MAFLGRTGTMVAAASIGGVVERVAVYVLHRGGGSRRCPAPGRAGVLNLGRPERERCARLRPNSYYLISFVLQSGAVSLSRARVDGVAVPRVGQYSGSRNRRTRKKGCSPGGWSGERAAVPSCGERCVERRTTLTPEEAALDSAESSPAARFERRTSNRTL